MNADFFFVLSLTVGTQWMHSGCTVDIQWMLEMHEISAAIDILLLRPKPRRVDFTRDEKI